MAFQGSASDQNEFEPNPHLDRSLHYSLNLTKSPEATSPLHGKTTGAGARKTHLCAIRGPALHVLHFWLAQLRVNGMDSVLQAENHFQN